MSKEKYIIKYKMENFDSWWYSTGIIDDATHSISEMFDKKVKK